MKGYQAEPRRPAGRSARCSSSTRIAASTPISRTSPGALAVAGYRAVAPDFLSPAGGTPADQDAARDAIGKLDSRRPAADAVATLALLRSLPGAQRQGRARSASAGAGGWSTASRSPPAPALDAGVPFYGPAPDPALAPRVRGGDAAPLCRAGRAGERDRPALGRGAAGGRQEGRMRTSIRASTTPSTTTRRPSATTRPRRSSPGGATLDFFD